jgi:hypothetical protein
MARRPTKRRRSIYLWKSEEIEFVESFGIPTFVVPDLRLFPSQEISLTKEVFQRVSGNYRNNFCQKVVY